MPELVTDPLRLVVIGAGPKALFALEALAARLEDGECATSDGKDGEPVLSPVPPCPSARRQLEVSVVDPGEHAGTGAAYAPDQPHELRLNVSPRLLDAAAGGAFPSFEEWAAQHAPRHAAQTSPPRAVVGDYLTQRWRRMTDRLGAHARCRRMVARATSVQEQGTGLRIALDGDPEHSTPLTADEVLVATGHGAGHDGALAMGWSAPLPLVPAVLPARTMLSPTAVPPGARVALRGAALTFLDAALALTEGRGAEFVPSSERSRPLLHRRSPLEPSVLLPTARHGLLLEAKPVPGTALATPRSDALADGARRLTELRADDADVVRRLLGVLTMTSARLLEEVGEADRTYGPDVEQTLSDGAEPDLPVGPGRAEEALRRSVAVARGERAPGPAWALGRTWARLYPQVTALLRGSTLDEDRWAELRTAAQVLERFAFGPPLETAEKLLAMVDSGAVDLSWVDARTTITATGPQGIPRGSDGPDLVIDAVLAPPGLRHLTDPLARQLLDSGAVSVRPGRRGAAVAPDGTALGADGRRREGLALLGRPTEDHVIGHDTLDRHLHDEGEHWAARLAERLAHRPTALPPGRDRMTPPSATDHESAAPGDLSAPAELTGRADPADLDGEAHLEGLDDPADPPDRAGPDGPDDLRGGCHGMPPLTARLAPWMQQLLADPHACAALVEEHGSPLNVHDFSALGDNAAELADAAHEAGVRLGIYAARKANKTLGLVEAVRQAGLGLDVGSLRELEQALDLGMPPSDIVVTAAIKPLPLLELALRTGAMLVLDNLDEASAVTDLIASGSVPGAPAVALRLAPGPSELIAPTRFGESAATWRAWETSRAAEHSPLRIEGVHFHLHGYTPESRAAAIAEAVELIDALRESGQRPRFLDIGGGIPMSYLDDPDQWAAFHDAHDAQDPDLERSVTWRAEPLRQVYPYHQRPVRGQWLRLLLGLEARTGTTVAEELRSRDLELRCEPGRSLLDGCGMTLARVVQRTTTSDGIPLVGLEMNRTQCRSTSDDFLVDPLLVRTGSEPSGPLEGFLVGAYCIESELILRRRLRFPGGVAVGDLIALPNTAGYLMHILESASHQLPLASNVVRGEHGVTRDGIDAVPTQRPWTTPPPATTPIA